MEVMYIEVNVKRSVKGREAAISSENGNTSHLVKNLKLGLSGKGSWLW
ncbi:hypothetical protein C5167_041693 [Papaver somniferum]|nr:hypothetical protein C5167_041693 [Papaver somniferum]